MNKLSVSICIPAYNEEKNVPHILQGLLEQETKLININQIVVVCSGCTDKTTEIVQTFMGLDNRIKLIEQDTRSGKAVAINAFIKVAVDPVLVVESADTIPAPDAIENLCRPFLKIKNLGMTGGAPIPVNDPETFLGYVIHTWWWFHRNIPRFGEIIAFRNVIGYLSPTTAVDEAFIQAKLIQRDYQIVHIDDAVVNNKGPETLKDLIKQRRRIFNGHARLYTEEKVKIDHMTKSTLHLLLYEYKIKNLKELVWLMGGILVEVYAQILGQFDIRKNINPFVWDTAHSTKDLSASVAQDIPRRSKKKGKSK